MKTQKYFITILVLISVNFFSFGQKNSKKFKMEGINHQTITIAETFNKSVEIFPFEKNGSKIFGLDASAKVELNGDKALVRLLLIDNNFNEHLIYESYNLLIEEEASFSIENICEETSVLDNLKPYSIQIEIKNATLELKSLSYSAGVEKGKNIAAIKIEKKKAQNEDKINKINKNLKKQRKRWVAGPTSVSKLSYAERKKLYGQSTFPAGFEYYAGGVISTSTEEGSLKSATAESSPYVDNWDWRDRHGKNWISPVTNQGSCGSCWAFASTGATESMVNVFFNQQLNLDLSEQDLLSCSGAGSCSGGYPGVALNYITSTGIVDEGTFPYSTSDEPCENKGSDPSELIKIGGKVFFGSTEFPKVEDVLKRMLIEMGPVSGGLLNWSHAMVLVGYKVVKEGDVFYYRNPQTFKYWITVSAGDPLIGKTVWIFKNSWGDSFGDEGYVYVETPITNMGWTYGLETPVTSNVKNYEVICEDNDGDGYFWWGIGEKPATCTGPDLPDGNDSDATLGPLDEYGNCTILNAQPTANFSANKTVITEGETVTFSDLSTNSPTSWAWVFEGGNPATSSLKNPVVTYNASNNYRVTLTVSNANGSDTKTIDNFIEVNAQVPSPVADFTAYNTVITEGETVTFSDLSTNTPTSWAWVFEGGTPATSNLQNPTVTYNSANSFKVTLTVQNAGGSDTKIVENYIEVTEFIAAPVADFTANNTVITEGETVTFSDLSTNNPTSWAWVFEGGTPATSNLQNPAVTYNSANSFKVTLSVQNAGGSDTKIVENYIEVTEFIAAPVADFTADNTVITEGETVTFSDLSTNNPTSWAWVFEGATPTTSNLQNPAVTYNSANSFKVTLTVQNAGGYDTKIVENYIEVTEFIAAPVADFTADNTAITEGETVTFSDLSTNNPTSWAWVFEGGIPATSNLQNPAVTYNSANSFKVTLTVQNAGGSDTKTIENYIEVNEPLPPPVADFTADNTVIIENEAVTFADLSTNNPVSWAWVFEGGNPSTSNLKNPKVTYNASNKFKVSLTVHSATGSDTKIIEDYIDVKEFVPSYCTSSGDATDEWISHVQMGENDHSSGSGGYEDFTSTVFNFESGKTYNIVLEPGFSSRNKFEYWSVWIDFNGDKDFSDSGEQVFVASKQRSSVVGSITIPDGIELETRMRVAMGKSAPSNCGFIGYGEVEDYTVLIKSPAPQPPVANFIANRFSIQVGENIQFSDLSLNGPTSWQWSFPGGTPDISTEQNPTVVYNTPGEHSVTLVVSKSGFDSSTEIKQGYIVVSEDSPVDYCKPLAINSSFDYIQNVTIGNILNRQTVGDNYSLSASAVSMVSGTNYSVSLTPHLTTTRNYWRIWIDFNGDGDFDDLDETILVANNKKGSISSFIQIPEYAKGSTRMRISMREKSAPSPCDDNFNGEVEDYNVSFGPAAPQSQQQLTSIDNGEFLQGLKIYPNPFNDNLNIKLNSTEPGDFYSIYNMNGKKLMSNQITSTLTTLSLVNHSSGIYLIVIVNEGKITNKKIIKK